MAEKRIQAGNEGEDLIPGVTENLSSAMHGERDAAHPDSSIGSDKAVAERGQFDRREEEVADRKR